MSLTDSLTGRRGTWSFGLASIIILTVLSPPLMGGGVSCYGCPGGFAIYDSFNRDGVFNNPQTVPVFTVTSQTYILQILNYHYNFGSGADPTGATISIVDNNTNATVYQGAAQSVPVGNPNTHWAVFPNMFLTPGTYRIEDSGRATWSYSTTNFFAQPGDGPNWAPGVGFSAVFSTPEPSVLTMMALGSGLIAVRLLHRRK